MSTRERIAVLTTNINRLECLLSTFEHNGDLVANIRLLNYYISKRSALLSSLISL